MKSFTVLLKFSYITVDKDLVASNKFVSKMTKLREPDGMAKLANAVLMKCVNFMITHELFCHSPIDFLCLLDFIILILRLHIRMQKKVHHHHHHHHHPTPHVQYKLGWSWSWSWWSWWWWMHVNTSVYMHKYRCICMFVWCILSSHSRPASVCYHLFS